MQRFLTTTAAVLALGIGAANVTAKASELWVCSVSWYILPRVETDQIMVRGDIETLTLYSDPSVKYIDGKPVPPRLYRILENNEVHMLAEATGKHDPHAAAELLLIDKENGDMRSALVLPDHAPLDLGHGHCRKDSTAAGP